MCWKTCIFNLLVFLYYVYTTEVGQTVLNRTVLALLYKPCWPGLVQLTSAQFYDCLHCQTNWANPCWPIKCASVNVVLVSLCTVPVLITFNVHYSWCTCVTSNESYHFRCFFIHVHVYFHPINAFRFYSLTHIDW